MTARQRTLECGTTHADSVSVSQLRIAKRKGTQFGCEECAYTQVLSARDSVYCVLRDESDEMRTDPQMSASKSSISMVRVQETQRACTAQLNGYGAALQTRSSMRGCRQPRSPRWSPTEAQAPWALRATRPLASSETARHRTHRPETSALASGHPPRPRPSCRQIHEPPKPAERLQRLQPLPRQLPRGWWLPSSPDVPGRQRSWSRLALRCEDDCPL